MTNAEQSLLQLMTNRLASFSLQRQLPKDDGIDDAAVLLAVTREELNPKIILTKRAEHLNSHSGEVAFPGGKWERDDTDLLYTALRESHEEINLPPENVEVVANLPLNHTRHNMRVTPYVGLVDPAQPLQANPNELDAVFQVPLRYLLDQANLEVHRFTGPDYSLLMPCYIYEGFYIWGFSLMVLVEFLNLTFDAGIRLNYPDKIRLTRDSQ